MLRFLFFSRPFSLAYIKGALNSFLFFSISGFILWLLLYAHRNPLDNHPPNETGRFLYQASVFAEESLNHGKSHGGMDYAYCVEGKFDNLAQQNVAVYCASLYEKIRVFSQKPNNASYQKLTIQDLQQVIPYFKVRGFYWNQVYLHAP